MKFPHKHTQTHKLTRSFDFPIPPVSLYCELPEVHYYIPPQWMNWTKPLTSATIIIGRPRPVLSHNKHSRYILHSKQNSTGLNGPLKILLPS